MTKAIMIQGTGSNVGKSLLVAGLCRAFAKRGLRVRPFKPQNMSNNAAVTSDGGEIGRAQALQALAAGVEPHTDMNPVLLKPESETGAQVVVQGQRLASVAARDYANLKPQLMAAVSESFRREKAKADLVVVEGAGSPAEVNLRSGDIANMGFAETENVPVVLVGDIDRGGVIAQIVGTHAVLEENDRNRIRGFIVNKLRGDVSLFEKGVEEIVRHTGWQSLGVAPWFSDARKLPAEDIMDIRSGGNQGFRIAVPRLSRIANFDDLDPLAQEPGVSVDIIEPGSPIPGTTDLVLIPGTKSTIADLNYFRAQGWDTDLAAHIRRGGHVLGICGGYQMLGQAINDDLGIEGRPDRVKGLGYLNVVTEMRPEKHLSKVRAVYTEENVELSGYEIHIGETTGPDCDNGWLAIDGQAHGAQTKDGRIRGCYLHGLFVDDAFRSAFLRNLDVGTTGQKYSDSVETTLNELASHLEAHLDLDALLEIAAEDL